jgi:PHD/YefM family antitoxin component YafN of YafNO toxin-antitoxin module
LVKAREEYIVDEGGKRKAVVLPVKEYERLREDLHDLAVIAERREEPTSSLADVRRRLKTDGFLRD